MARQNDVDETSLLTPRRQQPVRSAFPPNTPTPVCRLPQLTHSLVQRVFVRDSEIDASVGHENGVTNGDREGGARAMRCDAMRHDSDHR
ncbi:hypothetical protein CCMSSC00406_0008634 [Pleurotus cornucopiae]|uniref:Uncharacterized protein n=1 Tax=Pleurotus cornucopiae TaxID=5321 RepID=A0ACB7IGN5_PLECO|nr:hypothetical protein CCMSSC00406_0008634 [Pleurotus cornucopiae]